MAICVHCDERTIHRLFSKICIFIQPLASSFTSFSFIQPEKCSIRFHMKSVKNDWKWSFHCQWVSKSSPVKFRLWTTKIKDWFNQRVLTGLFRSFLNDPTLVNNILNTVAPSYLFMQDVNVRSSCCKMKKRHVCELGNRCCFHFGRDTGFSRKKLHMDAKLLSIVHTGTSETPKNKHHSFWCSDGR